jgi:hypothetical protein
MYKRRWARDERTMRPERATLTDFWPREKRRRRPLVDDDGVRARLYAVMSPQERDVCGGRVTDDCENRNDHRRVRHVCERNNIYSVLFLFLQANYINATMTTTELRTERLHAWQWTETIFLYETFTTGRDVISLKTTLGKYLVNTAHRYNKFFFFFKNTYVRTVSGTYAKYVLRKRKNNKKKLKKKKKQQQKPRNKSADDCT